MAKGAIRIPIVSSFDDKGVKKAEKGFGSLGSKMKLAGGIIAGVLAGIAAAVVLPVKALLDLGQEFDSAFDKIRIGTGQTGRVFEELQQTFRDVAEGSASSFDDISTAVMELNTRLGLTGEPLETLADQMTTLARITDDDLGAILESTTRLFNRANIPIEEQSDLLDRLFRASQLSGTAVSELAQQVLDNRIAFENAGFSLDETIALIAQFGRDGVDASKIAAAFGKAQRDLARDQIPLKEGLQDIFTRLREVDEQMAYQMGADIFGRNMNEVVAAIRDGRLEYGDFANAIMTGDDSIMAIAEETDDVQEAWDRFKNYLKLIFEPAATAVFGEVSRFVDEELVGAANRVKVAFEQGGIESAISQIGIEINRIYDEYFKPLWDEKIKPFFQNTVKPALLEIGTEIGTAVGGAMADAISDELPKRLMRWASKWSPSGLINRLTEKIVGGVLSRVEEQLSSASPSVSGGGGGGGGGSTVSRVSVQSQRLPLDTLDAMVSAGSPVAVSPGAIQVTVNVSGSTSVSEVRRAVDGSMDDALARLARELAVS